MMPYFCGTSLVTCFASTCKNVYEFLCHNRKVLVYSKGKWTKGKEKSQKEPTPNRVQSSKFELPRCKGGKDSKEGLIDKRKRTFSVLGKMLAISGLSGVVGQGTGKVRSC
jgi:hypothetical protein